MITQKSEFKKEARYVVLKLSKMTAHQKTALGAVLSEINLSEDAMPDCVVVESDWPNYQDTWSDIQAVSEGRFISRDELAAQLVAVKEGGGTGQSPCRKYCESVATWKDYDQLREHADKMKVERDALAFILAEHDRLHKEINAILHPEGGAPEKPSLCDLVSYLRSDMAEIRAEAGRDGFVAGINARRSIEYDINSGDWMAADKAADEYAAKIRQGGE